MKVVRDLKRRDSKKILILSKEQTVELKKIKPKKEEYVIFNAGDHNDSTSLKFKNFLRVFIAGFIILFVMNLLSIGNQIFNISSNVEVDAYAGVNSFIEGGKNASDANLGGAIQSFEAANKAFADAQKQIWFLGSQPIINEKGIAGSAYEILESGKLLTEAASYFSQGVSEINEIPILFVQNNSSISLTEMLKSSLALFNQAFDKVNLAREKIASANTILLPDNFRSKFNDISSKLDELNVLINKLKERIPAVLKLLGDRYPHRYMILLQNNTEARPTGGFIGSYLIVDVNDGYISKFDFHDVYESDGQLNESIPAPEEMSTLTENWRMRDSNYSPDFPLSAAKAAWFLEKEEGPSVDTVIAVNQSIIKDLFTITGPVQLDGLTAPITAENYNTILTYIIEAKLEGASDPKAVLERFIPVLKEKLYDKASFKSLFSIIQKGILEKQILAWSKDEDIEALFSDMGVAGEIKKTASNEDFLSLITINIGGNKSDLYMQSEILHETTIGKNGEVKDKLTYTRKHTWNPNVILDWKEQLNPFGYSDLPEGLQNILGRGNNKSVIKLYLPKGSVVEDVVGIDKAELHSGTDEALDKTFVYFILDTAPQNERVVSLLYKLPEKLNISTIDEYKFTVQKQPGSIYNTKLIKRITADPGIKNYRNYPEEVVYNENRTIEYKTVLNVDQYFASLWGIE